MDLLPNSGISKRLQAFWWESGAGGGGGGVPTF